MLVVELDIFSGRRNPSWLLDSKDEKELIDRLTAEPTLMRPLSSTSGHLGYRGYIIRALDEPAVGTRLPSLFRIGGEAGSSIDASLWLLDTSDDFGTEVDDYLRQLVDTQIAQVEVEGTQTGAAPTDETTGAGMSCVSNYLTSSTDFSFWNGASHILVNNCYNYAANERANNFAQPGAKSGNPYTAFTCSNVAAAVRSDGWADSCRTANNLTIALVIAPGLDFHFYRKCSGGRWCHKPGDTAARNTDNAGKLISNPETCSRGIYTSFCEYFYVDNSVVIV